MPTKASCGRQWCRCGGCPAQPLMKSRVAARTVQIGALALRCPLLTSAPPLPQQRHAPLASCLTLLYSWQIQSEAGLGSGPIMGLAPAFTLRANGVLYDLPGFLAMWRGRRVGAIQSEASGVFELFGGRW